MFRLRSSTRSATATLGSRFSSTAAPDPLITSLRIALKESMKARESSRVSVIKSVLSDIQNLQHTTSPPPPSKILSKAISARLDAASTFSSAQPPREDLAEQYRSEASILQSFAPEEEEGLSPDKVDQAVRSVLQGLGMEKVTAKEIGAVMKAAMSALKGQAGGKEINESVKRVVETLGK